MFGEVVDGVYGVCCVLFVVGCDGYVDVGLVDSFVKVESGKVVFEVFGGG